jgi:Ca-activated chloride channel family protein
MIFLSPLLTPFLLLIPLLLVVYIWVWRRKRRYAVRYSSLSLIREAIPKHASWRHHLPFALFLLALTGLLLALARPAAEVEVPLSRTSIILALDVSRSMCATDVSPNRLSVAQEAALAFIEDQADGTRIGLVAFAGFAELIVPPTNDKEPLQEAVRNLTTSLGTAIGSATLKSIDAIADVNEAVAYSGVNLGSEGGLLDLAEDLYQPDIIVLLTDGANSQGPLPVDAAQQAADRQVRVYTIGFGTTDPERMSCTQQQLGSDVFSGGFSGGFGGFGGGGGNFRRFLLIDEPTLQEVAELTGGTYYRAENADQLYEVFLELPTQIVLQKENTELSFLFSAIGAFLFLAAFWLSFRWNRYP